LHSEAKQTGVLLKAQKESCERAQAKNNERVDILLTSVVSLLAAITGGWIAGKYALRAQKQAAEDQRRRDVEAERRTINSTLQAIATELTVLKADFLDRLQQVYDARENRRARGFQIRGPLSRNYFAVFESTAAMLGKIDDNDLREKIIRVYGSAKSLFDHLNYYSRQSDIEKDAKLEELEEKIREQIEDIQKMVSDLQKLILKYRQHC
jgi:hypothetical protein